MDAGILKRGKFNQIAYCIKFLTVVPPSLYKLLHYSRKRLLRRPRLVRIGGNMPVESQSRFLKYLFCLTLQFPAAVSYADRINAGKRVLILW